LASSGKTNYENEYNSGVASNGLTSARHDVLTRYYAEHYPETYEPSLDHEVVYIGPHRLTDKTNVSGYGDLEIGKLLLSPTRTFAPVLKVLLTEYFQSIHGLIHCSGGGQTKCLKYLPENLRVVKNNLPPVPEIFRIIQKASGSDAREMYQVFNMGTRMEIYTDEKDADSILAVASQLGVDARIIGHVENAEKTELRIKTDEGEILY